MAKPIGGDCTDCAVGEHNECKDALCECRFKWHSVAVRRG